MLYGRLATHGVSFPTYTLGNIGWGRIGTRSRIEIRSGYSKQEWDSGLGRMGLEKMRADGIARRTILLQRHRDLVLTPQCRSGKFGPGPQEIALLCI